MYSAFTRETFLFIHGLSEASRFSHVIKKEGRQSTWLLEKLYLDA